PSKTSSPHSLGAVVTLCVFSPHPQGFILPRRRLAPSPHGVPLTGACEAQCFANSEFGLRSSEKMGPAVGII
ncbi:MAG: hypothetical protein IJA39_04250, partial [Clostridia bacterium]|nr:hypothetical protein [Clostridia bacterium]